ncbi:LPXTG cell wall anchor domain-containing protein [Enterococcus casseliflavus]|uniref:LPXTG cell wall anchor domain-containing protein n=1 Tax=Enterococcus casseliflavus TaxID=37734 RepID=UPI001CD78DF5|nr:LPXTG cell wall anchor domain-containing protein [Enterococcus casseliflavus]
MKKIIYLFLVAVSFFLLISYEVHGDTHRMRSEAVVSFYEKDNSKDSETNEADILPQTNDRNSNLKWIGTMILFFILIFLKRNNEYENSSCSYKKDSK